MVLERERERSGGLMECHRGTRDPH